MYERAVSSGIINGIMTLKQFRLCCRSGTSTFPLSLLSDRASLALEEQNLRQLEEARSQAASRAEEEELAWEVEKEREAEEMAELIEKLRKTRLDKSDRAKKR